MSAPASTEYLGGELNSPVVERLSKGLMSAPASTEYLGGELNSPVAEQLNKGLMDKSQLGRFFGIRKYLAGELRNSPVAEWLKGLMTAWSPTQGGAAHAGGLLRYARAGIPGAHSRSDRR
eukprot:2376432-Pyramimonas_sp.AAC.1